MPISPQQIKQIITEINGQSEKTRRALAKRRHDIYKDGGRAFLIESIRREFNEDALKEMRLAPINLLKKIVNKRSSIYKKAPTRKCELESDQNLVDFYTEEMGVNTVFAKANRYYTLQANEALYTRPVPSKEEPGKFCLKSDVVPPYLYSIEVSQDDNTVVVGYVFSSFVEEGRVTPTSYVPSATGAGNFSLEPGYAAPGDLVASSEIKTDEGRRYIFWFEDAHFTTDAQGNMLATSDAENPIGRLPVVNIAKDRDNEPWATQGEDMIDLTIAIQLGWSDLLTIAKHQGFSLLTITSEEEPKQMTMGINKAIWLKSMPGGGATAMAYAQAQSPLDQYKQLLMELLGLLLSTNDMDPGSVGGAAAQRNFTSGFHQLIAMSDNIEAVEMDKPTFLEAEKEYWDILAAWHNYLYDSQSLEADAQALGRFSEEFSPSIQFADVKPLQSEDEVLSRVERQMALGLMTDEDALGKLYPDLSADEITAKLAEIKAQRDTKMADMQAQMAAQPVGPDGKALPPEDVKSQGHEATTMVPA